MVDLCPSVLHPVLGPKNPSYDGGGFAIGAVNAAWTPYSVASRLPTALQVLLFSAGLRRAMKLHVTKVGRFSIQVTKESRMPTEGNGCKIGIRTIDQEGGCRTGRRKTSVTETALVFADVAADTYPQKSCFLGLLLPQVLRSLTLGYGTSDFSVCPFGTYAPKPIVGNFCSSCIRRLRVATLPQRRSNSWRKR